MPPAGRGAARHVAGGERESIFQPQWSPAGELHFASDRSGWWNLYRERAGADRAAACRWRRSSASRSGCSACRCTASPADGAIVCLYEQGGRSHLARIDRRRRLRRDRDALLLAARAAASAAGFAACFAASEREGEALVRFDLASAAFTRAAPRQRDRATTPPTSRSPSRSSSRPRAAAPRTPSSTRRATPRFVGEPGTRPPLLVISHGGPTGVSNAGPRPAPAVLDPARLRRGRRQLRRLAPATAGPTASGSTAAGAWSTSTTWSTRPASWSARGDVDPKRLAIRGASAGGYTTLAALAFRDIFQAGASHYGISDLETLARDTHKFESRYLDSLVGPYPDAAPTCTASARRRTSSTGCRAP